MRTVLRLVGFGLAYFLGDQTWEEQKSKAREAGNIIAVDKERMKEAELAAAE